MALFGLQPNQEGHVANSVTDGLWHHIAGVWNGSRRKIFVDGETVLSASAVGEIPAENYTCKIGVSGPNYFEGLIDEVRIYNRAVDETEIIRSFEHKLPLNKTGLILWMDFEEGSETVPMDCSGNENHGMIFGAELVKWAYWGFKDD